MAESLLRLQGLGRDYPVKRPGWLLPKQTLVAVDQIDLEVMRGETLGLVGESGCGKSTLGKMICRLETPSRGELFFSQLALGGLRGEKLRILRRKFQPVFQDPLGSLNPRLNVFQTLQEPLRLAGREGALHEIREMLKMVGLGDEVLFRFAHQLSGGQRQRLGLARALAVEPELIVADEPVSSLDVSIQAQILNLFVTLQRKLNLTVIFISHDLRVINHVSDRVAVMYMGRIMEMAPTRELFSNPRHPYTWALLEALPKLRPGRGRKRALLAGELPSPVDPEPGCRFYSRCQYWQPVCRDYENDLETVASQHTVACRRWQDSEMMRQRKKSTQFPLGEIGYEL